MDPPAKDTADLYFKGEVEACGYTFITDNKWTCSGQPPADEGWLKADFDDSHWERAVWVSACSSLRCAVRSFDALLPAGPLPPSTPQQPVTDTPPPQPHTHTQTQISEDYKVAEISDDAKYITMANPKTKAMYCRLVVPNPTYMG
jgi:hypothetical protein